ncbi:hypothetical protein L3Q82_019846 [Scortum barcoo]|uniref:Uncharacterized protein n=1 Tax=Scortum barcoo TaxID=214431 RepID=A0ACB8VCS8_9TELE|nr:hypothetical protein L3Q82_019846 [Scortum barcoo]
MPLGRVITVPGSDGETSPGRDRDVAQVSREKPPQEQALSAEKHFKIAPLFLRAKQHRKSKQRRDDGKSVERLQKSVPPPPPPPQSPDVQQVGGLHLTERGQVSSSALHVCLKGIQTSNPSFPVQAVFSKLQRKASERLQEAGSTAEDSQDPSIPQSHLKEKRKRGSESSDRVAKRARSSLSAEGVVGLGCRPVSTQEGATLTVKKQPGGNRLSRTRRLRRQSESPVSNHEPDSHFVSPSDSRPHKTSDIPQRDSSFEDTLWTDKYSPQHSSEVIGNSASVKKLQCWLKKWKLRADCDERRKMEERKREENSNDSWDCGDFQGEAGTEDDREELLCNTLLITGPPGVGKTAAVYACSQELGFKVFEVNCSSQRSGRHVLAQLKEATQSHLVEMSGKDPLKPTYFNNYNINSCTPKSDSLPGKTVPLKNVTSTSKKRAARNSGRSSRKEKANPATVTLANYFKMQAKADRFHSSGLSPSEKPDGKESGTPSPSSDQTVAQNKKTATSLILFEEVDVIFDDDVGFLAAIKTFMTTTKRPVILTTNDPSFRERFNCSMEEIIFKTPSHVTVCSYLQLVALAENVRLELEDVCSLLRLFGGDIRRCLLQLQLWVNSGGGRASLSGSFPKEPTAVQHSSVTEGGDANSQLPRCDTGCTASMLGLQPRQVWSDTDMIKFLRLLAESWRGGVPLLYSNLELLLPISAKGTSVCFQDTGAGAGLQSELAPSDIDRRIQQLDGNIGPKQSTTISKSNVRYISRLSRRKCISTLDTTSPSISQKRTFSSKSAPYSRYKTKQNAARLATDCLDALTDFFDLMSYLDATTPAAAPLTSGSCRPDAFAWTGAEIKDGLLDEMNEEEEGEVGKSQSKERLFDIQAAVEGFGCHRCCSRVSVAQKYSQETRLERLTLPASSKRRSFSFSFQPLCDPNVSQKRYELSRTVLSSEAFSLLGNRQAVSVDYMPVLRHIFHFQREQQQREEPIRCLKYLSSKHLGLSKSTIQLLAEDFS